MGITPKDIQAQRELLERGERILEAQEQQAERERLRDTFAAAALTGFIRGIPDNSVFHLGLIAKQAYEVADAMMLERLQTESAEYTDGISPSTETKSTVKIRREVADLRGTPQTHATPGDGSVPREGTEPVADPFNLATAEEFHAEIARLHGEIDKLRQRLRLADAALLSDSPTLTEAEREAVEQACGTLRHMSTDHQSVATTLRGILERLK